MSQIDINSDGSISIRKWLIAIGFDNPLTFTFLTAAGAAFDITGYVFSLQVRKKGQRSNLYNYTEGKGLTNNGALGTVSSTALNDIDSATLKNRGEYFVQLSVTLPSGDKRRWYNGTIYASSELHDATSTAVSATIDIGGTVISATITLGGGASSFAALTGAPGDNAALAAALALKLDALFTQYEKTDSYTLLAADLTAVNEGENVLYVLNTGTAKNFTVPLNATIAFPVGTVLTLLRIGAGQWTVVATGGVTITGSAGVLTDAGQNQFMILTKTATNTWYLANGSAAAAGVGDVVGPASATDNAVVLFDGTTGKLIKDSAALLSRRLIYKSNAPASPGSHTGNTTETPLDAILIPANTFAANDIVHITALFTKVGAAGAFTGRIRNNTQANGAVVASSTLMAMVSTGTASNIWFKLDREMIMKNALNSAVIYNVSVGGATDVIIFNTAKLTLTTDWSAAHYIFATGALANAGDTCVLEAFYIEVIR